MMAMAKVAGGDATPTPLSEGVSTVSITVSTRWRFEKK